MTEAEKAGDSGRGGRGHVYIRCVSSTSLENSLAFEDQGGPPVVSGRSLGFESDFPLHFTVWSPRQPRPLVFVSVDVIHLFIKILQVLDC